MLTGSQLKRIAPSMTDAYAATVADSLTRICPQYGINTPDIFHEFIANVLEECGEFRRFTESLNYSADALIAKFGRHRISIADAKKFGRIGTIQKANQQAIANLLYGGEWGRINLGNIHVNDGWMFRGSGVIQNTGRRNIAKFAHYYNKRFGTQYSLEQMAELLRTNLDISVHSACWFFAIAKELIDEAINDQMKLIVNRINGGNNGMDKRLIYLDRARKVIV